MKNTFPLPKKQQKPMMKRKEKMPTYHALFMNQLRVFFRTEIASFYTQLIQVHYITIFDQARQFKELKECYINYDPFKFTKEKKIRNKLSGKSISN